jgi:nucleotide-binding universal stress UspA family protein
MKTILVPVDFSRTAIGAFRYARRLAAHLNVEVKIISVYHEPVNYRPDGYIIEHELAKARESCVSRLKDFIDVENTQDHFSKPVIYEAVYGYASTAIVENAKGTGIDMIVMGTTGEHDVAEEWLGSVSSNVAQNATRPVWLVPRGYQFRPIRKILYACDFDEEFDLTTEGELAELAKSLGAGIHTVFIKNKNKDYGVDRRVIRELFRFDEPSVVFTSEVIEGTNVPENIKRAAMNNECDILAVSTRQRDFWESLFHKSVTKQLALHPEMPVLVLHKEDEKNDVRPEDAALAAVK